MCFYIENLAWLKWPEVRDRVTGLKPSGDGSHSRSSSASLSNSKRRCFYNVVKSAAEASTAADSNNSAAVPTAANSTNESPIRSMGEVLQQKQQQAQAMMQEFKIAASEADLARAETSGAASNSSSGTIMSLFRAL